MLRQERKRKIDNRGTDFFSACFVTLNPIKSTRGATYNTDTNELSIVQTRRVLMETSGGCLR